MRRLGNRLQGTRHRLRTHAARSRAKTLAIESLEPRGMLSATIDSFAGDVEPVSECEYAGDVQYATDGQDTVAPGDTGDLGCFWGYESWDDSSYDYGSVDDCGYVADYEFGNPSDDASWYDWGYPSDGYVSDDTYSIDEGYASDSYATDISWDAGEGTLGWIGDPVASLSLWWPSQTLDCGYLIVSESISPTWQRHGDLRLEGPVGTLGLISTTPTYDDGVLIGSPFWPSTLSYSTGGPERCELFPPPAVDAFMCWSDDLTAADPSAAYGDPAVQRTLSFESYAVAGEPAAQGAGRATNSRASGDLAAAAAWFALPNVEAAGVSPTAGKRRPAPPSK